MADNNSGDGGSSGASPAARRAPAEVSLSLLGIPCFKTSLIAGLASGSFLAAVTLLRKPLFFSVNVGLIGGSLVATGKWFVCRSQFETKRDTLTTFMNSQGRKQQQQDPTSPTPSEEPPKV